MQCCNKFETGYDDPRLGVLFIDRPLLGARAVQVNTLTHAHFTCIAADMHAYTGDCQLS